MPAPTYNQTSAGFEHNGCSHNTNGNQTADFVAKMLHDTKRWEPDSDGIVDHLVDIHVKAIRDGKPLEYTRTISLADWAADRVGVIKRLVPRGSVFDDTAGQLSRAIEVSGSHPELFPVRPESCWRDGGGEFEMNKCLCNRPVQIIGEWQNPQTGETIYRLKSGNARTDVSYQNLLDGNFGFPGGFQIQDRISLFMRLRREWASQSKTTRLQMVKDEHLDLIKGIEAKMSALGGQ